MNKFIIPVVVIAVIFVGFLFTQDNNSGSNEHGNEPVESYEIHPGNVVEKMENKEDIILLDVRTLEEYEEIHLENALLLPVEELSQGTLSDIGLGKDMKDKEIIIYCRSGARSKIAYDVMTSLGYTNIKSVSGGMIHWQEDDYPFTESGEYNGKIIETTKNDVVEGAKISFNKTLFDFGEIPKSGGKIKTVFEVKNTGSETLEIGELTTSCGCTTAIISEKSILPGEIAQLSVVFDPDFHAEPLDKITRTVFIPSNDVENPESEVKIAVDILEDK